MQPPARQLSTCPTCGAALGETFGGGLGCMSCLLQAGIGSEEGVAKDSTPDALAGGVRFGVYEIDCHADGSLCELGRGAMGVTYRATDTSLQRKVALKIIKTDIADRSADARERFIREARAAAAFRHEHIATVFQFGMRLETGQYFYAMELIEGETLEDRVHRKGPLDARTTIKIGQQVASALAAAEKHGLVHRDLKPANLMLVNADDADAAGSDRTPSKRSKMRALRRSGTPVVKIIDFGLAKAFHTATDPKSLTHDRFVGTPAFASPEQFEHSALDVRSDIYSLGETLWFALTGETLFAGHSLTEIHRAQESNALPIEQLKAAHVPHRLKSLLESMLGFEPASRPGPGELAERLQRCSPEVRRARRSRVALAAAAVVFGASTLFLAYRSRVQNAALNIAPYKTIAVLPFENLSDQKQNAYFADGVQDEILTDLARIADLKVISRTSVMQYKSDIARDLRQIGQQLGVANVVEGSVQRFGNRVRVNARLTDVRTGGNLWAQSYDRDLADVFAIQSEIAKTIASQLQVKLSLPEKNAIERAPTSDIVAFDLYTRAGNLLLTSFSSAAKPKLLEAAELLDQAVARDPSFYKAYCRLVQTHDQLYFQGYDHTPARLALGEAAIKAAIRLHPDAGDTHLARALDLYWGHLDYDGALAELELARQTLPNDPQISYFTGLIQRRQGHWEESTRNLERSIVLDPRNFSTLQQIGLSYGLLHRYAEQTSVFQRALDVEPDDVNTKIALAAVQFHWKADTQALRQTVDSIRATNPEALPNVANDWLSCALAERNITAAHNALDAFGDTPLTDYAVHFNRALMEGIIARMTNDDARARAAFTTALEEQEKIVQVQPNYGPAVCVLGLIDAGLGRKEEALREGRRAVELLPVQKDAINGPLMIEYLAMIAAWVGDKDLACEQLAIAIRPATTVSYGHLKLYPHWDPLRGYPRFEQIVASLAPEGIANNTAEKSIAVLPFEDLSDNKEHASLSDGVQDDLSTKLAKVADLKVISRTSVMQYRGKHNVREIGQQLGVAHVVEGTIRRAGGKLHVNVQLVDARTGTDIWAEEYDRNLSQVFAIEAEVARSVANRLSAKVTHGEQTAMQERPTNDLVAFDLYTRAKNLLITAFTMEPRPRLTQAIDLLNQAIGRDPSFFDPYCQLAYAHDGLYQLGFDHTLARLASAEAAIQSAFRLRPDAGETHLARAWNLYWGYLDYNGALAELKVARQTLPNNPQLVELQGGIERRLGHWEESTRDLERVIELDPRNVDWLAQTALNYRWFRRYAEENSVLDRALTIEPNYAAIKAERAWVELARTADTRPLRQIIDSIQATDPAAGPTIADFRLICALGERNAPAAENALRGMHENAIRLVRANNVIFSRTFVEGLIARMAKDDRNARAAFTAARVEQEKTIKAQPNYGPPLCVLGLIDAALGRKEEALREGRRAVELLPTDKDAFQGAVMLKYFAMIAAWVGDKDLACEQLETLIGAPSDLSYGQLKLMPFWDPLRGDPRFEKMVEEAKQPLALK